MFHMLKFHRSIVRFGIIAGFIGLISMIGVPPISAQSAVGLGAAGSFAVLGGSTVTNTGSSTIFGNLGISPGSAVTGFPPGLVSGGAIHQADALALQAKNDLVTAYNGLAGQAPTRDLSNQDLGTVGPLIPGVYHYSSSAQLTGALVLDAQGKSDAVFIFQIVSTLTTATNSSVSVINGGSACNVFWEVGSSATIGTTTRFLGNILALTSITLNTGASIAPGRALARNGAVTLDTNNISIGGCGSGSSAWANDNRVNPNAAEVFAAYCDAAAFRIILVNESSAAGAEWSVPFGTLIAAGPGGVSKDLGRYGVFSVSMDSKGYFHAALNGGIFHSNGQKTGAKDGNCTVLAGSTAATRLPATGYTPANVPDFAPEMVASASRLLVLPSGAKLPVVESYRSGDSWSVANLGHSVGHLDGTNWLGDAGGNIVLVGHVNDRKGNPGPFGALAQTKTGDVFTLYDGSRQVAYRVVSVSSVAPQDMQIIGPNGHSQLTLITCSDWNPSTSSFKTRLVVIAVLA